MAEEKLTLVASDRLVGKIAMQMIQLEIWRETKRYFDLRPKTNPTIAVQKAFPTNEGTFHTSTVIKRAMPENQLISVYA